MFVQSEKFLEEHCGRRCLATTSCCYTGIFASVAGKLEKFACYRADAEFQTVIEQNSSVPSISKKNATSRST